MIDVPFPSAAAEVESTISFKVDCPNLVSSSHCKKKRVSVNSHDIPRRTEALLIWLFIPFFVEAFFPSADDGENFSPSQVHLTYCVILGVTNEQENLVLFDNEAHSMRVVELSFIERAVDQPNLAVSDLRFKSHGLFVD